MVLWGNDGFTLGNYGKLNAELIGRDGELMVTMGNYGLLVI